MFFFKKPKPATMLKDSGAAAPAPGSAPAKEQKRGTYRANVKFPVLYSLAGRPGVRNGGATDLSGGGLRLAVDEDLPSGAILELRFTLPATVLEVLKTEKEEIEITPFGNRPVKKVVGAKPFAPMRVAAKTVVAFFNIERKRFEYGVAFPDIDQALQEEIQRWIHGWQLLQLRLRREREG